MAKIIEKIKNFFSNLKCFSKKEVQKPEQGECKTEEKSEEQKQCS